MPGMSVVRWPIPRRRVAARHCVPALGLHQLRPTAIELPVVALAKAAITGPGAKRGIKAFTPEPHLIVDWQTPRDNATAGLGAFLPIIHVVLLKGAGRAKAANPG